ncbi:hypothetical protein ACP70R_021996 [Stipagrostis hirtigluma subsp. patula]
MELQPLLLWAAVALSLIYYISSLRHHRSGTRRLPPGPRPLPVVGNLFHLRGNLHHTLAQHSGVHGPVMYLKVLTTKIVVISSSDAAREAFTKHDRRLAEHHTPDAVHALRWAERSMVWLPSSNPRWITMRGIMARYVFSPRSLSMKQSVRERKVRDMVSYFRGCAGQEVDVRFALLKCMVNLASNSLFSIDVVDVASNSLQGLLENLQEITAFLRKSNISDILPFLSPLDLQGSRRSLGRHLGKIFSMLDNIIDSRLEVASSSEHKQNDFLDTLLDLMSAGKITRDNVTNILFEVFGGGADAVVATVVWTMAELLRNQHIMTKLRAEIEGSLGRKEIVEEADMASLPYLQAVLKESMRLHPVVPILVHKAVEDGVEISGYTIPKGSTVMFNTWAIMHDPNLWERPDEFRPERFMDKAAEMKHWGKDFEFLPFGSGRRLCPGIQLTDRVMPLVLASLLHAFEWRLPDGMSAEQLDMSESFGTVTSMAVPLKAVPIVIT